MKKQFEMYEFAADKLYKPEHRFIILGPDSKIFLTGPFREAEAVVICEGLNKAYHNERRIHDLENEMEKLALPKS